MGKALGRRTNKLFLCRWHGAGLNGIATAIPVTIGCAFIATPAPRSSMAAGAGSRIARYPDANLTPVCAKCIAASNVIVPKRNR